ncbi:MAG: hypothetical protein HOP11_03190 [Saprospiraceae bacterium]|nr:hypothetical protein [Saprospiraceae bacterium]
MNSNFSSLIKYFPLTQLPFTLEKGSEHEFGMNNDQFPASVFDELVAPYLPFEVDEFTEMIPGVHYRTLDNKYVIVFWVAKLLSHSFYLFTYSEDGEWLDNAEVAGFFYENGQVLHRIANINDPQSIYIVEAVLPSDSGILNPSSTSKWVIEIKPDGKFLQLDASEL